MAKKEPSINKIIDKFGKDYNALSPLRDEFEEKEEILLGKTSETGEGRAKVFDPRISTYILERAARVMAQNPTGIVRGMNKKSDNAAYLLNLIIKNYVLPNASSQFDFLTKTRMWDVYSNVYGSFGVLVDWVIRDDYIGPDFYLIPMRNLVFQSNVQTFNESEYVYVISYVTKDWLKSKDRKIWKNVDEFLEKVSEKEKKEKSKLEEKYGSEFKGYEIITRYEKDRWITFSQDQKMILCDIENPQKNGKLPVVLKHCFPLLDRIIGLGEVERTASLQKAMNSFISLYLEGEKMRIFPPLLINPQSTILRTIKYEAGAKWLVQQPNAVNQFVPAATAASAFQQTYSFLNAALLNAFGTSDVATTSQTEPSMGKTPRALAMLATRESSRDNWDRFMMERALEEVLDRFVDLISKRQEKPMKFQISREEFENIKDLKPDLAEIFERNKYGEIIVKTDEVKNTSCKYYIEAGSTLRQDELLENENLTAVLSLIMKIPGAMEQIAQAGKIRLGSTMVDFGQLLKQWIATAGVKNYDKIITEGEEAAGGQQGIANFEDLSDIISQFSPDLQERIKKIYDNQNRQPYPPSGGIGEAGIPGEAINQEELI